MKRYFDWILNTSLSSNWQFCHGYHCVNCWYLDKCFCNKRTPIDMFFMTVLKICQMYSFSIYPGKFKIICKNLSIYPWLKAFFRKLLRFGCFSGNFPQYLRACLTSESYTSRWLRWIELYAVVSYHYCTDFFLCSEEQGDYCSILLYDGMQKLFKIDHQPYSSNRKLCCSPLFFKNCEILEKIRTKICETVSKEETTVRWWETLWNWMTHGETVRVETSENCLMHLGEEIYF